MNELPIFKYMGEVVVIESADEAQKAVDKLRKYSILGFDTETRPTFKKGIKNDISLLQLACSNCVYLFRLKKFVVPDCLRKLLADKKITKVGVGIRDDLRGLKKFNNNKEVSADSFLDLQNYVEKFGITDKAFSKLMALIFKVKISKKQRTTNWEADELKEAQIRYAATDVWGALKMYEELSTHFIPISEE
ncbi:MAG: 3'-5' exonuclease domain-containing protein 2 [Odoribacter sp.]|nr:3'-5' exonuclease domain-containing protein 2 [Odoribacter sp.]